MLSWFKALTLGKQIAVGAGTFFAVTTAAGMATPTQEPPTQQAQEQAQTQAAQDTIETETVTETEDIPFKTIEKEDTILPKGEKKITQPGENGVLSNIYEITYRNGVEESKTKTSEEVTKEPKDKIVAVGTYVEPEPEPEPVQTNCDSNYTPCVPNVSYDLDCPDIGFRVRVIGYDKHRFDGNDNDGWGCESY